VRRHPRAVDAAAVPLPDRRVTKRVTIRVDPITCDGHGLCAELLPEHIRLDDWGYPIVDGVPVAPELVSLARRAVAACPTLALLMETRHD
jgi:ferredoxin